LRLENPQSRFKRDPSLYSVTNPMLISTGYKSQNSSTKKQINLIVQNKKNQTSEV